ncbi:hypothetical protein T492DRAFT_1063124, partial [Pavlovales sp. CCMP2436]
MIEMGGTVRPLQRIHFCPFRLKLDLANRSKLRRAVAEFKKALEAWLHKLPPRI